MSRRKSEKEDGCPQMEKRLSAAFWSLLEERDLHDITVGDLVERAGCNRGSFYYYYESRERFVEHVVCDGFLSTCGLQEFIVDVICGKEPAAALDEERCDSERLMLLVRHGGLGIVARDIRRRTFATWTAVLRPDGGSLREETSGVLEFLVGGFVGVLTSCDETGVGSLKGALRDYLQVVVKAAIESVARIEGTAWQEVVSRFKAIGQYSKMSRAQLAPELVGAA